MWKHENIGKFWKEKREQGPPLRDPQYVDIGITMFLFFLAFFPLKLRYGISLNFCGPWVNATVFLGMKNCYKADKIVASSL